MSSQFPDLNAVEPNPNENSPIIASNKFNLKKIQKLILAKYNLIVILNQMTIILQTKMKMQTRKLQMLMQIWKK